MAAPNQEWSPAISKYIQLFAEECAPAQTDSGDVDFPGSATESSYDRLSRYLASDDNSNAMANVTEDTSYPISDYFISSSHNTYLWGNQLYGKASTKAYRKVLERGCRCVEIDVWDGEEDSDTSDSSGDSDNEDQGEVKKLSRRFKDKLGLSKAKTDEQSKPKLPSNSPESDESSPLYRTVSRIEPRVLHGHTATKEVSFRKVCATIRDYAFTRRYFTYKKDHFKF